MATLGLEINSNCPPATPETVKVRLPLALSTSVADISLPERTTLPPSLMLSVLLTSTGASLTAVPVMFFVPVIAGATPSSTLVAMVKSLL